MVNWGCSLVLRWVVVIWFANYDGSLLFAEALLCLLCWVYLGFVLFYFWCFGYVVYCCYVCCFDWLFGLSLICCLFKFVLYNSVVYCDCLLLCCVSVCVICGLFVGVVLCGCCLF